MKKFKQYIYQSSADFTRAMLWEAKYIFRDRAVFFSFVIVAVLVSFLYTYLYSEETLQELPIGAGLLQSFISYFKLLFLHSNKM